MSNLSTCGSESCSTQNEATEATYLQPRYSTQKLDEAWEIKAVVPGVKKADVAITYENDEITIVAKRNSPVPESWRPVAVRHRDSDGYQLRLGVNVDIDGDAIAAHLEDGILTVTLPLSEAAKPRVIPVE